MSGRSWQKDGTLSARYWSEAAKEKTEPSGIFYFWKGERPRDPTTPQIEGTGEIRLESSERATGYWITQVDNAPCRTAGVYLRADPADLTVLDGRDDRHRAKLIADRLKSWKSISKG
jgi:hypothetical protein